MEGGADRHDRPGGGGHAVNVYEYLCHGDDCREGVLRKGWLCPQHYALTKRLRQHAAYVKWVIGLGYPATDVSMEGLFNAGWDARDRL